MPTEKERSLQVSETKVDATKISTTEDLLLDFWPRSSEVSRLNANDFTRLLWCVQDDDGLEPCRIVDGAISFLQSGKSICRERRREWVGGIGRRGIFQSGARPSEIADSVFARALCEAERLRERDKRALWDSINVDNATEKKRVVLREGEGNEKGDLD
uniref:Uncharacterized protein n=1 Tax=Vespula pensylvanica TaxID=30213 RepID=A0A834P6R2_VESPE|nr:hypothetical protein H0235_006512 [Vespula pensylvanica]